MSRGGTAQLSDISSGATCVADLDSRALAVTKEASGNSCGPLESPGWPETDPSRANEVKSGRWQGATKEYTLTVALRRCVCACHVDTLHHANTLSFYIHHVNTQGHVIYTMSC